MSNLPGEDPVIGCVVLFHVVSTEHRPARLAWILGMTVSVRSFSFPPCFPQPGPFGPFLSCLIAQGERHIQAQSNDLERGLLMLPLPVVRVCSSEMRMREGIPEGA